MRTLCVYCELTAASGAGEAEGRRVDRLEPTGKQVQITSFPLSFWPWKDSTSDLPSSRESEGSIPRVQSWHTWCLHRLFYYRHLLVWI